MESFDPRKWHVHKKGSGVPLSIFDQPDPKPKSASGVLSPLVVNAIAVIVTVIWSASFIADIVVKDYAPPGSIHIAFMVILGGIFGVQIAQGKSRE